MRALKDLFACDDDQLGLYGAFGYDVAFQFEPIDLKLERPEDQRDVVLFLPDEILIVDHHGKRAYVLEYDFVVNGRTTKGSGTDRRETRLFARQPRSGTRRP